MASNGWQPPTTAKNELLEGKVEIQKIVYENKKINYFMQLKQGFFMLTEKYL
jgi:hypothetical protein